MKKIYVLLISFISLISPILLSHSTNAACAAQPADMGAVTQTVNVPTAGVYKIWSRVMAPNATANSFVLEIDNTICGIVVGDNAMSANTWNWVDHRDGNTASKVSINLTAGSHSLRMLGREAGVKLDRVILTADTTCLPAGTGGNCVVVADTTPPAVSIASPTNSTTISGTSVIAANASDSIGVTKVDFYVNGTLKNSDSATPFSYPLDTTTLSDGAAVLTAKAFDAAGNNATSPPVSVTVTNQPVGQADLVVTSIMLSPVTPLPTQQTVFSAVVKNQGTAATTLGINHGVRFDVDGQVASWSGGNTGISIAPGASATIVATSGPDGTKDWAATEGNHAIKATVDDLNLISESDNNNNSFSTNITVQPPPDTQSPSVPAGLNATPVSSTSVNLAWTASTDNVGVTNYWIVRNGVAIASLPTAGTATSYTDNTVQPSTAYSYQVVASDLAGNTSAYSAVATTTTPAPPDTTPPTAPTDVVAISLSSSQINIIWTAATDNIGVASYDVYRSTGTAQASKIATVTTTSYGNTGLSLNTTYTYYVVAKDAAGQQSLPSNTASAKTFSTTSSGNIYGSVRSPSAVIKGAYVRFTVNGSLRSTKTNSQGLYLMTNIPADSYIVSYSAQGFISQQQLLTIVPDVTTGKTVILQVQ